MAPKFRRVNNYMKAFNVIIITHCVYFCQYSQLRKHTKYYRFNLINKLFI